MDPTTRVEVAIAKAITSPYAVREVALEIGYGQLAGQDNLAEALRDATERRTFSSDALARLRRLTEGVTRERQTLDQRIAARLKSGWALDRIALIDRAVLRIAIYELWFEPDLSPRVVVSEAVRLAQIFGSPENVRFVNGLLGRIVPESPKANWTPPAEPAVEVATEPEAVSRDVPIAPPLTGDWALDTESTSDQSDLLPAIEYETATLAGWQVRRTIAPAPDPESEPSPEPITDPEPEPL